MSEPLPQVVGEAYRHCEQVVRAQDKDRFLTSLYAPADRRRYLFALYAFALEIARVKALVREPMAGTIRLQWWLEAIAGLRTEEAAASPVMIALQHASRQTGVALAPLTAAVEARQDELHGKAAVKAASSVFAIAAQLLGAENDLTAAVDAAAKAVTFAGEPGTTREAREGYAAFRKELDRVPRRALPAFLPVAVVPLRLRSPDAAPWRRQVAIARAAWLGFPRS
jgi:phytoene/squalene synthetase